MNDVALIVDEFGDETLLGEFLTRLVKSSDLGVAEIARRAHLSRSFLYLLMSDRQSPSVESLLALFEALEADEVHTAEPGHPGDIGLQWRGRRYWVKLPRGSRQAERSRSALRTLNTSRSSESAEYDVAPMAAPMSAAGPRAFAVNAMSADDFAGSVVSSQEASDRSRLLAELVARASALDEEQLRLLIENARLMGPR
jgi:transcriptional regulator with XRE-family HTH domain